MARLPSIRHSSLPLTKASGFATGVVRISLWDQALEILDENQVHELDGWLESLISDPEGIRSVSPTAAAAGDQFIRDCIDAAKQQRAVLRDRLLTIEKVDG